MLIFVILHLVPDLEFDWLSGLPRTVLYIVQQHWDFVSHVCMTLNADYIIIP